MKSWKRSSQAKSKAGLPASTILVLAAVLCVLAAVASLCFGAAKLSLDRLWGALLSGPDSTAGYILWYARIPRTAACLLAGAGLAVSGAVIQGVLANSLASPGIIGVNAGAGLAVTVCCAAGVLSGWAVAGFSFLGALTAALLVTVAAQKAGASRTTVILGGVAVNSFLNALAEAVRTLVPETAIQSADFRVGGFSSVVTARLWPAGALILAALVVTLTLHNELDVMALGEETAQGLGLRVKGMRTLFLLLAALMAGASVSFAGLLGFVGLIVPHIARALVGGESGKLLPLCALGGAGFVTVCDLLARVVFAPFELPVGILLSVIGGPFFILLLWRRKGGRYSD